MRISKEKAEANRAEVVAQASRLFRQRGLDGPSVAELMRAAGLTHGGFYNHFASKADLQASALIHNFDVATARLAPIAAETDAAARADALRSYIQRYLSPTSRDADAAGCPMVAFGADVSREEAEVRAAYAAGLERYVTVLAQIVAGDAAATPGSEAPGLESRGLETGAPAPEPAGEGGRDGEAAAQGGRAKAIALLATLVGGLSLARSIAGINPQLSDELLATTRAQALALTTALARTEAGEQAPRA